MDRHKPLLEPLREECRALLSLPGKPFFLRRCFGDGFLFVSDLPRRVSHEALMPVLLSLKSSGFAGIFVPNEALLYVDATLALYEALLGDLPGAPDALSLPRDDALYPVYALCRLLLLHPTPLHQQPLGPLRWALKWAQAELDFTPPAPGPGPLKASPSAGGVEATSARLPVQISRLHQQCAARLRLRQPLPCAAGQVLASWLAAADTPGPSNTHAT